MHCMLAASHVSFKVAVCCVSLLCMLPEDAGLMAVTPLALQRAPDHRLFFNLLYVSYFIVVLCWKDCWPAEGDCVCVRVC